MVGRLPRLCLQPNPSWKTNFGTAGFAARVRLCCRAGSTEPSRPRRRLAPPTPHVPFGHPPVTSARHALHRSGARRNPAVERTRAPQRGCVKRRGTSIAVALTMSTPSASYAFAHPWGPRAGLCVAGVQLGGSDFAARGSAAPPCRPRAASAAASSSTAGSPVASRASAHRSEPVPEAGNEALAGITRRVRHC